MTRAKDISKILTDADISGNIDVDGVTNLDVVDIDGAVDMASTLAVTGIATFTDDIIIGDGKTIGSASKVDAITIASSGLTQLRSTGIVAGSPVLQVIDDGTTILNVRAEDGNISFPVAGAGIYLGVTAGASSNLLDDYEEGTWTPSVGGNSSYHNQTGKYTKIGRTVHVTGTVQPNTLGTGSTTTVSGFPFATSNAQIGGYASGSIGFHYFLAVNVITIDMLMGHGTTATAFQGKTSASQTSSSALAIFGNGARVDFAITYETS